MEEEGAEEGKAKKKTSRGLYLGTSRRYGVRGSPMAIKLGKTTWERGKNSRS